MMGKTAWENKSTCKEKMCMYACVSAWICVCMHVVGREQVVRAFQFFSSCTHAFPRLFYHWFFWDCVTWAINWISAPCSQEYSVVEISVSQAFAVCFLNLLLPELPYPSLTSLTLSSSVVLLKKLSLFCFPFSLGPTYVLLLLWCFLLILAAYGDLVLLWVPAVM